MGAEKVAELRALRIPGLPRFKAAGSDAAKWLYFVRHGEATHNVQPKPWGEELIDARLTPNGQQQAKSLRDKATELRIEVVLVSPLARAIETATLGLAPLMQRGVPFVVVEGCREQLGKNLPDKRRTLSEVAAEYPMVDWGTIQKSSSDGDELFTPSREELHALSMRADAFLELVMTRPEQHICVVTHSSFLAALLNVALDTTEAPEISQWFANAECRVVPVAKMEA